MKPGIHPAYHPVVFRDRAADYAFLTRSTATSEKTVEWEDGHTYPVIDVEISSVSHLLYAQLSAVSRCWSGCIPRCSIGVGNWI